jgi:hypothetical protein
MLHLWRMTIAVLIVVMPANFFTAVAVAAAPRTVDLIPLIDADKDAVNGIWKSSDGAITSDNSQYARLRIPYEPPEEYDFQIEFIRSSGNECVAQMFRHSGHSCMWNMGGDGNTICGFTLIEGLDSHDKKILPDSKTKPCCKMAALIDP